MVVNNYSPASILTAVSGAWVLLCFVITAATLMGTLIWAVVGLPYVRCPRLVNYSMNARACLLALCCEYLKPTSQHIVNAKDAFRACVGQSHVCFVARGCLHPYRRLIVG